MAHGPPGCHCHRGLLRIPAPGFEQRHQKHTRTRVCEPKIWVCTTMKLLFRLTFVKSKTVTPNTNNRAKPGRRPQTWAERRLGLTLDTRDYSHATSTENLPISRGRVVAPAAREAELPQTRTQKPRDIERTCATIRCESRDADLEKKGCWAC